MNQDDIRDWLQTVPTKLLLSEVGRRNNASRRTNAGGRPKVLHICVMCGKSVCTRELAAKCPEHKPRT